jgi:hydroxyacylglutathione hydrolase
MFFKRFYDDALAQASYLIGCQRTGGALVVDPNRDVRQYLEAARAEGLHVTHVTETHIHADFVSGARELASRAGARLLLSGEGGAEWQYGYAADGGVTLLRDGDSFTIGNIRIDVMHTPGHTPEHLSFVVTDTPASSAPWGILTGDFVFVGDVGRPDLLERAAGYANTMESGARTLFRSLDRFRALPDHVQVWPGHGAGSACGKALGTLASSTVGYEKLGNWGVSASNEDTFVRDVLAGQPEPPVYFAQMKRINRDGPVVLGEAAFDTSSITVLAPERLDELVRRGEVIVDTRTAADFASGHVPGTLNIPFNSAFTGWAGWLLPYDRSVYLIVDDATWSRVPQIRRALAMIGLDRVAGVFREDALAARALARVSQAGAAEVAAMINRGAAHVIDVRGRAEYETGHIPGVPNIPVGHLAGHVAQLPTDKPIVVQCQAGTRSAIAASILLGRGVGGVINLAGGIAAWQRAGLPVTEAV